mmetsp:Transcript_79512/g.219922  ORF Transcript_79512/g.219922 Transcript_79512/m.219922 type:complete len:374 (-) Transcript_79512:41-1162(-)
MRPLALLTAASLLAAPTQGVRQQGRESSAGGHAKEDDSPYEDFAPPDPVCCARRKASSVGFKPILEYKLKEAGKFCHGRSTFSSNFPEEVSMSCCAYLRVGQKSKASDSPCLESGIDCGQFNAVKAGPRTCKCAGHRPECVQTKLKPDHERIDAYHGGCPAGEFSPREQYLYGLLCMGAEETSCQGFGAHAEKSKSGFCACSTNDVCVGRECGEVNRAGGLGFNLSSAHIKGLGKLKQWQHEELVKLGVTFEVGCVHMGCEVFNAVSRGGKCHCTPRKYEFGQVPRQPKPDWDGPFHTQEGWDKGFWCKVHAKDDPRCPPGQYDTVGLRSTEDQEPYCECGYKQGCQGPHCVKVDGSWFYPTLLTDSHRCMRT